MKKISLIVTLITLFIGQYGYADTPDKCQKAIDSFKALGNCGKSEFIMKYFGNEQARQKNGWCFTDIISEVEEITHIEASCLKGTAGYIKYSNDSLFFVDFTKWKKVLCDNVRPGMTFPQRRYNIAFNGVKYNRGYIQCGILNKSDSAVKVSFKYLKKERDKEILKNYDISKDTLVFELLPEIIITVHSSQPFGYVIDGEPSDQRTIASYGTLRVFVRMKKKHMRSLRYVKMILPSGENVTEKIAL